MLSLLLFREQVASLLEGSATCLDVPAQSPSMLERYGQLLRKFVYRTSFSKIRSNIIATAAHNSNKPGRKVMRPGCFMRRVPGRKRCYYQIQKQ